jgi:hypothetical protein
MALAISLRCQHQFEISEDGFLYYLRSLISMVSDWVSFLVYPNLFRLKALLLLSTSVCKPSYESLTSPSNVSYFPSKIVEMLRKGTNKSYTYRCSSISAKKTNLKSRRSRMESDASKSKKETSSRFKNIISSSFQPVSLIIPIGDGYHEHHL